MGKVVGMLKRQISRRRVENYRKAVILIWSCAFRARSKIFVGPHQDKMTVFCLSFAIITGYNRHLQGICHRWNLSEAKVRISAQSFG